MKDIIVIGGGLGGLFSALYLQAAGFEVTVIEKKQYPFHRVCGEYISNEVLPAFRELNLNLQSLQPALIEQFNLTSPAGKLLSAPLDLGGFGISRFALDHYLYETAKARGVKFYLQTSVETVNFRAGKFALQLSGGQNLQTGLVIGAFGKRTNLDRWLNRPFFKTRSPYLAVKYHLRTAQPTNVIALHNFKNGYAGISAIENDKFCFCYLTTRQNLKQAGTIAQLENTVLRRNPHLNRIFAESEFLYPQPEVINEISFAPKNPVENHILCCGDAAGLITPLCGNGMAMAIHSAKILTNCLVAYQTHQNREKLETTYTAAWKNQFARRLRTGRVVQQLFGGEMLSEITVAALQQMPGLVQRIMRQTHGQPF